MKIKLSGHHVEITDSIRQYVDEKFTKIASHFPSLISLDIILSKEHGMFNVEISTKYEGRSISVSGNDAVMFPTFSKAAKRLDSALTHRKGQLKENLHTKPEISSPEIAHEIIQDMDLSS